MPRPLSDLPLRKVTLNLYAEDMEALRRHYGDGYVSMAIQRLVHRHVNELYDKIVGEDHD